MNRAADQITPVVWLTNRRFGDGNSRIVTDRAIARENLTACIPKSMSIAEADKA